MRVLYSLLMLLLTPVAFAHFGLRGLRDRRWWRGWGQRLALGGPRGPFELVLHAASMGEVNAAAPLLRALLGRPAAGRILLTTFTPTGRARATELFGTQLAIAHPPLDLAGATSRFLRRQQPDVLVIVETEIWPNLLHAAASRDIPVLVVNARITARSLRGYQRFPRLSGPAFAGLRRVLAQSAADAGRFVACGTPAGRVENAGNLKFDLHLPEGLATDGAALRRAWGATRPVLVAGSTHAADEAALMDAFRAILDTHPDALLVLAPRHPERFEQAAAGIGQHGFSLARHARGESGAGAQCLLVDAMGALLPHYAAADLAFVGGTLAPVGGHNLLEPAALGRPLLFGPHTDHVQDIAARLLEAGAAMQVRDAASLAQVVLELWAGPERGLRMGEAGARLVADGRGALARAVGVIGETLAAKG